MKGSISQYIRTLYKIKLRKSCPVGAVEYRADCECGHSYVKFKSCKKEICPVCGKPDSSLHIERIGRWLPKILYIYEKYKTIGYLVVTLPKEFWRADRNWLKAFRRYVIRKLKRQGYIYGKARFHWSGDRSRTFYPHLNILVGGGWMEKDWLDGFKKDIANWLGTNQVVVNYRYTKNIYKIMHWVRYICRPTLLMINEKERVSVYYDLISNFTNDVEWGKPGRVDMDKYFKFDVGEVEKILDAKDFKVFCLMRNVCPYCREKLKWRRVKYNERWSENAVYVEHLWGDYAELRL